MPLDEFLFSKIAGYLKNISSKNKLPSINIGLESIKSKLTIIARAISGKMIDIYPAEQEGGFKGTSFFLPSNSNFFPTIESNYQFYFFRTIYLCYQLKLQKNWYMPTEINILKARELAKNCSSEIIQAANKDFPHFEETFTDLLSKINELTENKTSCQDFWLYGKFMKDQLANNGISNIEIHSPKPKLNNSKKQITTLKAKPIEEIQNLQIDIKQQEDYVLTHNFEKVETAEEFNNNWRDFDGSDELKKHENAIQEIQMKYTVRIDDEVHSVYQADFVENTTIAEIAETTISENHITYNEWDYQKQQYKIEYCKLFQAYQNKKDYLYYQSTLAQYKTVLSGLRKLFNSINNKRRIQKRQIYGNDIDIDSLMDLQMDLIARCTPFENIYQSEKKIEKDISILLLLDLSLSSDSYVAGNRIIDIEKHTAILFGEILNEYQIDFSVFGFYSKTRNFSTFLTLKDFDDSWNVGKMKIGAPQPVGYTRIGPSLRHAGNLISNRKTQNKWIIMLSDGKPNDYDKYEGKYGLNDVKQAIKELNQNHINAYALAIEASAKFYLPQMFGNNHYQILSNPLDLLTSLTKLYDRIKN